MPAARCAARALALALAAFAAGGALAGTGTLSISAVVLSNNNCSFRGASPTLNLGIDAASGTAVSTTASWTVRCNGGSGTAIWGITDNMGLYPSAGVRRMRHATVTTEFLPYTLNYPASGSIPRNTDVTITVGAEVGPSAFQNALPGSYSDTVTLTISP